MKYIELDVTVFSEEQSQICVAMLADYPFEAFDEQPSHLMAYIPEKAYEECADSVRSILEELGIEQYEFRAVEQQNWNQEWESDFQPVEVVTEDGQIIYIRAAHHSIRSSEAIDVVVAPRMSFGTGHHITTALMTKYIAQGDFTACRGLDMGCGTGVLAILAIKCGAAEMVAVDIDDWACDSCRDSAMLSGVEDKIDIRCGSIDVVEGERFDFICANINRNILVSMMPQFECLLSAGGHLLMSGFLEKDVTIISKQAASHNIRMVGRESCEGWAVMECIKK